MPQPWVIRWPPGSTSVWCDLRQAVYHLGLSLPTSNDKRGFPENPSSPDDLCPQALSGLSPCSLLPWWPPYPSAGDSEFTHIGDAALAYPQRE